MKVNRVWIAVILASFVGGLVGEMKDNSPEQLNAPVYYGSSPLLEEQKRTAEFAGYLTLFEEKLPLFTNLKPLKGTAPVYPAKDREKGLEGSLMVNVIVDTDGKVEKLVNTEIKATGQMTRAASDAVNKWIFPPIKQKGKKMRFIAEIPIFFKLDGQAASNQPSQSPKPTSATDSRK